MIVARPRAVPIPLPLIAFGPTRLNLGNGVVINSISRLMQLTWVRSATYLEQ